MNEKRKIKTTVLLIVGFIILVSGLNAIYQNQTRPILQENLDRSLQQYRDGTISEIDFATLTPFPWDRLYFFGPYQPCSRIVKTIENPFFWPTCKLRANITYDDSKALYIFTYHGVISQYLVTYHPYPLNMDTGIEDFTVEEARFTLSEYGNFVRPGDE